jgi:hypothetical protein
MAFAVASRQRVHHPSDADDAMDEPHFGQVGSLPDRGTVLAGRIGSIHPYLRRIRADITARVPA